MSKNTVVIVFPGGGYGTYLEWCLTTLTDGKEIVEPFNANGNSHKFVGFNLHNMVGWRKYMASNDQHKFIRIHPKRFNNESIRDNISEIAKDVLHIIYLHPLPQNVLLTVNNHFHKIWEDWFKHSFGNEHGIDASKIYQNWPVDPNTPVHEIPTWIKREFLSFYLMPAWFDQIEWERPLSFPCQNLTCVPVSHLLFDFVNTLRTIEKACNLQYKLAPEQLLPTHAKNLQLQKYLDQDRICNAVVESIRDNTNITWPALTLPSEAWIQWTLRNMGYEIKCHELNVFPTDSESLRNLLVRC